MAGLCQHSVALSAHRMLAHLARHAGRSVAGCWRVRVGFVAHWAGLLLLLVLLVGGGSEQRVVIYMRDFAADLRVSQSYSAAGLQDCWFRSLSAAGLQE